VAALLLVGAAKLPAQTETKACDAKSFTGAYGYKWSGFVYDNQGYSYFLGAVGRMVSDGAGNLTGSHTYSFDGTVIKQQYTGTYTVNEDCTGSITQTTVNAGSSHFDFVIVNDGAEVDVVQTDAYFVLTGELKRQQNPSASQSAGAATGGLPETITPSRR
jgi:hypothetical protein